MNIGMTELLFLNDPYQRTAIGKVVATDETGGIILDKSIFYATSGGQPGDSGRLTLNGRIIRIDTSSKGKAGAIILHARNKGNEEELPQVGDFVEQHIDWEKRYAYMRMHTALHLLSVVIPRPVTGGAISTSKGRLDFDMPEVLKDKASLALQLNEMVAQDFKITERWISDQQLEENPDLVKTMSVRPPQSAKRIRLIRIGSEIEQIDLQPCGGTHVAKTSEIGMVRIGKIEKKGKQNRRVNLILET